MVDRLVKCGRQGRECRYGDVIGSRPSESSLYEGGFGGGDFTRWSSPNIHLSMQSFTLLLSFTGGRVWHICSVIFGHNTAGMWFLSLEVMLNNAKNIAFSSTAATYGIPEEVPILETTSKVNPYGESKLMMETMRQG